MCNFDHIIHLDADWMWRWHRVNAKGLVVSTSRPFFWRSDAQSDYDDVHGWKLPIAA